MTVYIENGYLKTEDYNATDKNQKIFSCINEASFQWASCVNLQKNEDTSIEVLKDNPDFFEDERSGFLGKFSLYASIITVLITISFMGCTSKRIQEMPTDAQMIEHFNQYQKELEKLYLMIKNDSINHYPLFAQEEGKTLSISSNRQLEYDFLMKKIQIKSLWYSNPYQNSVNESVLFFYFGKGDATWGIDKGYEYVPDKYNETDKEFTEEELYDVAMKKHENCNLYKKINNNWNLFLMYDR